MKPVESSSPDHAILLNYARTDLRQLLESTLKPLAQQANALDIVLRTEIADDVPAEVELDPEKVAWAVTTLVGNAFRYVRRGTRLMPGGSIAVRVDYHAETDSVSITVEDDGAGIPEDKLPYLFKRAEGAVHAAGLSLKLIYDVIKAHGGHISVKSSTDRDESGTAITLKIPAHVPPG